MTDKTCPLCGKDTLTEHHDTTTLQPGGIIAKEITVEQKYSTCDHCEGQIVNPKQSLFNRAQVYKHMGDD